MSEERIPKKYNLLLVEDDLNTAEATVSALECFEFRLSHAYNGEACIAAVKQNEPSLILLDLELPDASGHQICAELRSSFSRKLPIIALSGCQDDAAIVRVLEAGADDFVGKANSITIVIAHIRAVLNRGERMSSPRAADQILRWQSIEFDRVGWQASVHGRSISLTPTELRLLELFMSSPGHVFTRNQIIEALHGAGYAVTPRTIDVHINGLRKQMGEDRTTLETVRGVGYRLGAGNS